MPVYFWNDPDGRKYHDAYFDTYAGIWYHGDYPDGVVHIQGCNFSPTADYVISNAANSEEMTPIVSGLTYAILPLPLWVRTGGNWTITVQNPGNKEYPMLIYCFEVELLES